MLSAFGWMLASVFLAGFYECCGVCDKPLQDSGGAQTNRSWLRLVPSSGSCGKEREVDWCPLGFIQVPYSLNPKGIPLK